MKEIEKEIIQTAIKHAEELLNENWPSISEMLKETPDGKINIGLAVALDWSEVKPKVKTVISYSRKWKDEREDELEDPNQTRLNFRGEVVPDEPATVEMTLSACEPEPEAEKPKRGRKSKESVAA